MTTTNPTIEAAAEAVVAYAVAYIDADVDAAARYTEFRAAIVTLAWMLDLRGEDEINALAETLACVCGKALALGTHVRGKR